MSGVVGSSDVKNEDLSFWGKAISDKRQAQRKIKIIKMNKILNLNVFHSSVEMSCHDGDLDYDDALYS